MQIANNTNNNTLSRLAYSATLAAGLLSPQYADSSELRAVPISRIPATIKSEAADRGVSPANIKLLGDEWVACQGDSCFPLGVAKRAGTDNPKKTSFTANDGVLEIVKPNYARLTEEGFQRFIVGRMMTHPEDGYVIVVSVPSLCPPCRSYKSAVESFAKNNTARTDPKTVVVEFDDFESARQFIGQVPGTYRELKFPYTIAVSPMTQDWKNYLATQPKPEVPKLSEIDGSLSAYLRRHRAVSEFIGGASESTIGDAYSRAVKLGAGR